MNYKGKKVEVVESGEQLTKVRKPGEEGKDFWVRTADLVTEAPPKVGKQRSRNYVLFLRVYELLRANVLPLRHIDITKALDPDAQSREMHHAVSAVLSGNHDVFLNDRKAETWTLQADADNWLVNKKPSGPTDAQKKAALVRKALRGIEKGSITELPEWFNAIVLPNEDND